MSWSFIEESLKETRKPVNEKKKRIFIRQLPPWHFLVPTVAGFDN